MPDQQVLSQPMIKFTAKGVHIIAGRVIEDLEGDRLLVQCAAGSDKLFESDQPIIYLIKRSISTIKESCTYSTQARSTERDFKMNT